MKTIRTHLENQKLWEEINTVKPLPFITEEMDSLFILWHGQQWLFSALEDNDATAIAKMVVHVFGDKWDSLLEAHGVSIAASSKRTLTETVNTVEDRTNERQETAKVSAYNEATLIDDTGTSSDGVEGLVGERTRTLTDETQSVKDAFDNLTRLDRLNIVRIAMQDVANFMKLDIY